MFIVRMLTGLKCHPVNRVTNMYMSVMSHYMYVRVTVDLLPPRHVLKSYKQVNSGAWNIEICHSFMIVGLTVLG